MKYPSRLLPALIIAVIATVLTALAACGGDDDSPTDFRPGQLTDPRSVPTATPWADPPEVIILDPDALTPIGGEPPPPANGNGNGGNGGNGEPGPQPGVCGDTYIVESGDTLLAIAERCGFDLDDVLAVNPGVDPAALSIGQEITLP